MKERAPLSLCRHLVLLVGLALGLPAGSAVAGEALRVTASAWPPYVDEALPDRGLAISLVTTALQRAGYPSVVKLEPWPEALEATVAGKYDVLASVWHTKERAQALSFSQPFITNHLKLIRRRDRDLVLRDVSDLEGLRVGVVADYAYTDEAYRATGLHLVAGGGVLDNLRALNDGKVDVVFADERVALYELNQKLVEQVRHVIVLPRSWVERGLRIAVPKKNPQHRQIVEAFDRAIEDMRKDGSYFAILAQFRVSP